MRPLPLSEWDDSLEHVVDDMGGQPLNVHALMANNPGLLNAWWDYRNYSVSGGSLEQRDCELIILRVAVHMRSWYEWGSHVDRGLTAGLDQQEIDRVRQGPSATQWNERDAMLLACVDDLFAERAVSSTTYKILVEYLSAEQIMDVIAIAGMYFTLGCMVNTWNIDLDTEVQSRLPDGVSEETFDIEDESED